MALPGMMFCRYCGKEIHESAPACPQCGGLQHPATKAGGGGAEPGLWMPVSALVCGIIGTLAALNDEPADADTITGMFVLGAISAVFAIVSLCNQATGRKMAIGAVVLSAIAVLGAIGHLAG